MIASINGTDISTVIQESTYKVDSNSEYTDWVDSNNTTHRIIKRQRVKGSFEAVFLDGLTMSYSDFMSLVNAATSDGVLTISLQINNKGTFEEKKCFYKISFDAPRKISSSLTFKKATITIEEQ